MFKKNIGLLNKDSKKKFLLIIGLSVLFIGVGIILIATNSLSGLMGDSVTEYYCEDSSYNLEGTNCVKEIKEKSILLGDLDGDDKVTEADLKVMSIYVDKVFDEENPEFTEEQILAADISKDDEIFDNDLTLLKEYFGGNGSMGNVYSDTIGVERNCKVGYTLNGTWCIKKDIVNAKAKEKEQYTIKFDANGGEGIMPELVLSSHEKIRISKNKFINGNKFFVGWNVYSTVQRKWLYYEGTDNSVSNSNYVFQNGDKTGKVQFDDEAYIQRLPIINNDVLIFYAQWFDKDDDHTIIKLDSGFEYLVKKGTKVNFSSYFDTNQKNQFYYKWYTYNYNKLIDQSECKRISKNTNLGDLTVNGYTYGIVQLYLDSKCTNKYKDEIKTKTQICLGCNLVDISFDEKNDTSYKKNTKVNVGINFHVNDNSNSYYYKVNSKLYDSQDNSIKSECKKIEGNKAFYPIIIDGTRSIEVAVYSNSDCSRYILNSSKSSKYKCKDCTNGVSVRFYANEKREKVEKDSLFKMKIEFYLKDKENDYYYILSNYLDGKLDYSSSCKKVTSDSIDGSFVLNGYRENKVVIYSDSKCKYKYLEDKSGAYSYPGIDKKSITITPIKAVTTNIQNGKATVDNKISEKNYVPNNSDLYFKIDFNIADKKNDYYYKFIAGGDYISEIGYPKYSFHQRDSQISECAKVPLSGSVNKMFSVKVTGKNNSGGPSYNGTENTVNARVVLYSDSNCKREIQYDNEKDNKIRYKLQTFNVKYDANGGKARILNSSVLNPQDDVSNYKYSNLLTFIYNYKNKTNYAGLPEIYKLGGYDLVGYKVKNSTGKYVCYKNSDKSSQGFLDESYCKKYGYVIYNDNDILSRTSSINGETLSFIAQWTDNPVEVIIGKFGYNQLSKGTVINIPISFKINDKENTYYYRWAYYKRNLNPNISDKDFIDNYIGFSSVYYDDGDGFGMPVFRNQAFNSWRHSACWKITDDEFFEPHLTVDQSVVAGMIEIYKDSKCSRMAYSEAKIYRTTEIYRCKDCGYR